MQVESPFESSKGVMRAALNRGLTLDPYFMQVEPPVITILGPTYAVRKAAAEIRETLAVGRTQPDKYQPGGLQLQCRAGLKLPAAVLASMQARLPMFQMQVHLHNVLC
jgi:hypothetical protein